MGTAFLTHMLLPHAVYPMQSHVRLSWLSLTGRRSQQAQWPPSSCPTTCPLGQGPCGRRSTMALAGAWQGRTGSPGSPLRRLRGGQQQRMGQGRVRASGVH